MHLIGKSATKIDEIMGKMKITNNIEIQLFNEFENGNDCVDELFDMLTYISPLNVKVVHSPIINGEDVNLEFIVNDIDRFRLNKTLELTGKLSNYYGREVIAVIHSAFYFEQFDKMPFILKEIEKFVEYYLNEYPNLVIAIENVIPCKITNSKDFYFRNGVFFDNVKLVKHLREKLNTTRVGTVLDTCHILVTLEMCNLIFGETYPEFIKELSIEKFFIENKDVVKLIHLCDVKNLGFGKKEHGIKFSYEKLYILSEILNQYVEYTYRCDITIEILEDDYIKNENFKHNYDLVKSILMSNSIIIE